MWIREGHRCPNLRVLYFSVPLGFSNMLQGCFCVFLGRYSYRRDAVCSAPLSRAVCRFPPSLGCSRRRQHVRNLCIRKHIHGRARKQPQDLKCMWVSCMWVLTPLFFQSWLTQLISFFSSSFFLFRSPTAIFIFLANGCVERQPSSTHIDFYHYIHQTTIHSGWYMLLCPSSNHFLWRLWRDKTRWDAEKVKHWKFPRNAGEVVPAMRAV